MPASIYVQDNTTAGVPNLAGFVWALRYQGLYHYNRSPWVERGYATACADIVELAKGSTPPPGGWLVELLDTSDQPGALGYHEDMAMVRHTVGSSGIHSTRGTALHPATGEPIPLAKVFVVTAEGDGVPASEVASHEVLESLVDPDVVDEAKLRKYLNATAHLWYIGEVGDPVQGRGYDVGAPEGRPTGVVVADFAYPAWWAQPQRRLGTAFASDAESWRSGSVLPRNLAAFELAPQGYMSVAPEAEPSAWTQIFGSDRHAAEAAQRGYEGGAGI